MKNKNIKYVAQWYSIFLTCVMILVQYYMDNNKNKKKMNERRKCINFLYKSK